LIHASIACAAYGSATGKYFANLTVADDLGRKASRWVLLAGDTFTDVKADYDRLRVERGDEGVIALRAKAEALRLRDSAPKPLLQGRHLIERGISPGKQVWNIAQ
jgi:hypothetical protein